MALLDKFFQVGRRRSITEQVIDHLSRLLNTKCAYGAWQEHFGLENYNNNLSRYQLAEKVVADVARTIEHYEKRIQIYSIEPCEGGDLLNMRLRISCMIAQEKQQLSIAFENKKEQITVEIDDERA